MKKVVFINGNRDGYTPSQCYSTMTVREFVDHLTENFDDDCEVFLRNDDGYTYGSISVYDIRHGRYDKDNVQCDID